MIRAAATLALSLALISLAWPSDVSAQQGQPRSPIAVKKISGTDIDTPVFSARGNQSTGNPKKWFRVHAEYETAPEWIDEVNFTFFVLVEGKTKDAPANSMFKGEVTHVHVPEGRNHVVDMFIHPNIIQRYGRAVQVAYEVRVGGRLVARGGEPEPSSAWWNNFSPVDGILLDRSKTPFALIEIDEQEIIKTK